MARRARRDRHVVLIVLAHRVRIRLTVAPRKHRHDALEGRMVQLVLAEHVLVAELELLLARAIEKKLLHLLVQVTKRRVDRIAVMLENGLHLAVRVCVEVLGKRREDSLGKRQRIVGHDEFQVKLHVAAEAAARRACAVGAVEREHARRDLGQADAAVDAREVLAEHQKLAVDDLHVDDALAHLQSRLQGIGEPLLHAFSHDEAVDDDLDRMLLRLVKADLFTKVDDLAVDAHAHIALAANAVENPLVLALLAAHDLRHDEELRALGQGLKLVHHLIDRLLRNGLAALRTMRAAGAREHQAHVVVDLRHRADRRARVAARRLLVDGNRRRKPLDVVDVGLVHLTEELPRIGRQRLYIAPLPLGVDRIKGERGLARSRKPRDDDELVARNLHVDILQVVGASALYANHILHQSCSSVQLLPII